METLAAWQEADAKFYEKTVEFPNVPAMKEIRNFVSQHLEHRKSPATIPLP